MLQANLQKKTGLVFSPLLHLVGKCHEEGFLQNATFIDQLKLRVSYGQTGNDRIDATATQFLFSHR